MLDIVIFFAYCLAAAGILAAILAVFVLMLAMVYGVIDYRKKLKNADPSNR